MTSRTWFLRRVMALLRAYPGHVTAEELIRYGHYYTDMAKRCG